MKRTRSVRLAVALVVLMPVAALASFVASQAAAQVPGNDAMVSVIREGGSVATLLLILGFGVLVLKYGASMMRSWEKGKAEEAKIEEYRAKIAVSFAALAKYVERIVERTPRQREPVEGE